MRPRDQGAGPVARKSLVAAGRTIRSIYGIWAKVQPKSATQMRARVQFLLWPNRAYSARQGGLTILRASSTFGPYSHRLTIASSIIALPKVLIRVAPTIQFAVSESFPERLGNRGVLAALRDSKVANTPTKVVRSSHHPEPTPIRVNGRQQTLLTTFSSGCVARRAGTGAHRSSYSIHHQPLELRVLFAQRPSSHSSFSARPLYSALPHVKDGFGCPVLAANIRHPLAAPGLMQRPQNLLLACAFFSHLPVLLIRV